MVKIKIKSLYFRNAEIEKIKERRIQIPFQDKNLFNFIHSMDLKWFLPTLSLATSNNDQCDIFCSEPQLQGPNAKGEAANWHRK